jgi:hypothetical protein
MAYVDAFTLPTLRATKAELRHFVEPAVPGKYRHLPGFPFHFVTAIFPEASGDTIRPL